jgi:hypothetical protein
MHEISNILLNCIKSNQNKGIFTRSFVQALYQQLILSNKIKKENIETKIELFYFFTSFK